jgi:hypothetical protein
MQAEEQTRNRCGFLRIFGGQRIAANVELAETEAAELCRGKSGIGGEITPFATPSALKNGSDQRHSLLPPAAP